MKRKWVVLLLAIGCSTLAGDAGPAVDVGVNICNNNETYWPAVSFSLYWFKAKNCHEISYIHFNDRNGKSNVEDWFCQGIFYSYLIKTPVKFLYAGPTIGVLASSTQHVHKEPSLIPFSDSISVYTTNDGLYFCGLDAMFIFGGKNIRLKVQDRLVMGISGVNRETTYGISNSLGAGLMIVF
jgi:hypothetical protein